MNLRSLFAGNKRTLAVGGAAAAVGLGLYARHKGQAGAAGAPTASVQGTPSSSPQGAYDSTANDVYNSIEPQLQSLADQLGKVGATVTDQGSQISTILGTIPPAGTNGTPVLPGSPASAPAAGGLMGSGYGAGSLADAAGYRWIPDAAAFMQLPPGTPTYYQPSPGVFANAAGAGLAPGTPQFTGPPPAAVAAPAGSGWKRIRQFTGAQ